MSDFAEIIIYPIQRIAALLFSMEVAGGVSVGALAVAAALLMILFKALVGIHLSVFNVSTKHIRKEKDDED